MGPKKTLRFVAKYADACNLFLGYGKERVEKALNTLEKHCENENRSFNNIEKTVLTSVYLNQPEVPDKMTTGAKNLKEVEDVIETLREMSDLGIDHVIFNMRDPIAEHSPLLVFKDEIISQI